MMHIRQKRLGIASMTGHPTLWHAIVTGEVLEGRTAVCGYKPTYHWADQEGCEVTCPRCLDRMSRPDFDRAARRRRS